MDQEQVKRAFVERELYHMLLVMIGDAADELMTLHKARNIVSGHSMMDHQIEKHIEMIRERARVRNIEQLPEDTNEANNGD